MRSLDFFRRPHILGNIHDPFMSRASAVYFRVLKNLFLCILYSVPSAVDTLQVSKITGILSLTWKNIYNT